MPKRCIFCMEEPGPDEKSCPSCGKSRWDYQWQEHWLHPYTILKERYFIGAVLGESAYAITYAGYDQLLCQKVAVKEYYPHSRARRERKRQEVCFSSPEGASGKADFLSEAGMLFGQYDQAGLAAVKDVFEENGTAYLVMEYLPGGSLREYLACQKNHRLGEKEAAALLLPVMEALTFLHACGLVHCGLHGDNLMLDENGACRLIGLGTCRERARQKGTAAYGCMAAPEVRWEKDWIGPWSDVYQLCGLFYELLTGRAIREKDKRFRKRVPGKGSSPGDISPAAWQAVLQGLEPAISQRYFYIGTLLEKLGVDGPGVKRQLGELMSLWGELWLNISACQQVATSSGRRRILTKKQKKRLAAGAAAAAALLLAAAGGYRYYAWKYPAEVLELRVQREQKEAREHLPGLMVKGMEGYDQLLEGIKACGEEEAYDNGTLYTLDKEDVQKLGLTSDYYQTFAIEKDTLVEALNLYLDKEITADAGTYWQGNAFLYPGKLGKLTVSAYETVSCSLPSKCTNPSLEIKYDIAAGDVVSLTISSEREDCETVMKKILPLLVPEAFLTDSEIGGLFQKAEDEETSATIVNHAKYSLSLYCSDYLSAQSGEPKCWTLSISPYLNSVIPESLEETNVQYAGNYGRDSEEYRAFEAFLEEKALLVEQEEDSTVYHIDEEAVREWGQPSNVHMLAVTAPELVQGLTEKGYALELEEHKCDPTVAFRPYGVINADLCATDKYSLGEGLKVWITYDLLTERIYRAYVFHTEDDLDETAACAADLAKLVSEDIDTGYEELAKGIKESLEQVKQEYEDDPENEQYHWTIYADGNYTLLDGNEEMGYTVLFLRYAYYQFWSEWAAPYNWR